MKSLFLYLFIFLGACSPEKNSLQFPTPPQEDSALFIPGDFSAQMSKTALGEVSLSWSKSLGASEYLILYRKLGDSEYSVFKIVSGERLPLQGLKTSKTYQFQVVAINKHGSRSSNKVLINF